MALTAAVLALILGAQAKTKVIEEHFDQVPRGGAPKGWDPVSLDRGPLGIWGAGRVRQPGSWPQALLQDGRPYPSRWVGLKIPGIYDSFSARVLVGGGSLGSGAAGLAVADRMGLAEIFAVLAGGRGLRISQRGKDGEWESRDILANEPVPGPWLIFITVDASGQARVSFGTVESIVFREEWAVGTISSDPGWRLLLAARTEGKWWFDDLRINGKLQMANDK